MRELKIDLLDTVDGDEEKVNRIYTVQYRYTHFGTFPARHHSTWAVPT
jgi:hypothetical protein